MHGRKSGRGVRVVRGTYTTVRWAGAQEEMALAFQMTCVERMGDYGMPEAAVKGGWKTAHDWFVESR